MECDESAFALDKLLLRYGALPESVGICTFVKYLVTVARAYTGALPESVLSTLLFDVLGVVQQLHAAGLIHNDIDLRSFILSPSTGELKITNFSFSFFPAFTPGGSLDSSSDFRWQAPSSRFFGPLRHQSPERLLGLRCALRTK